MKTIKSIFFAAVTATLALSSCSSDDYSYSSGEKSAGAYIVADKSTFVFTPGQEQVLNIKVARTETADAETVTLSGDNAKFQVPASVSFAAGEKDKAITIPFAMATGESEKLNLKITSATSQYAPGSLALTVNCDYNWKSLGKGKFTDGFFMGETYEVEILSTSDLPGSYRVVKPYNGAIKDEGAPDGLSLNGKQCEYIQFRLLNVGEVLQGVTLTLPDLVYFKEAETGYTYDDLSSSISILHPSDKDNLRTENDYSHNKVLEYQEDGTPGIVQLAPRYLMTPDGRGWNHNLDDGYILITFPGYSPKDNALDFKYLGCFADQFTSAEYALGNVTLGADIASAKLAVATDATYDAVVAGLTDGTLEGVTVEASGQVKVPVTGATDHYYMVVVAFNEEGKAVATDDFRFFFTSPKEQWTIVGTGAYTYGVEGYEEGGITGESFYDGTVSSTLYKSTTTDGLYTIKPWANSTANHGLTFWWNTETNDLVIDGADTGDEDIYEVEGETVNDGPVVFYGLDVLGFDQYTSTYDPATQTFNFLGAYVPTEGWYGAIKETFVLDAPSTTRSFGFRAKAQKAMQNKKHTTPVSMKRALSAQKVKPIQ